MLRFSVLNMTSLSAQARETLFAVLQKAAHDLGHGKVALDYQDLVDIKLIDSTLSVEKIEEILLSLERELISVYAFQWSLSASSLRTKLIPLLDSVSYGIQSYKDIRLTVRIKKRFLDGLDQELEIQRKLSTLTFKSKYSLPLFYLLEKTSFRSLSKKQIHALFRAPGGYKTADLMRKVLTPAISDLKPIYPFLRVSRPSEKTNGKDNLFIFETLPEDRVLEGSDRGKAKKIHSVSSLSEKKNITRLETSSKKETLKRKDSIRKAEKRVTARPQINKELPLSRTLEKTAVARAEINSRASKRSLNAADPLPSIEQIEMVLKNIPYKGDAQALQKELDKARQRSELYNWKGFLIHLVKSSIRKNSL